MRWWLPVVLALPLVAARSDKKEQEEARLHFKIAQVAMKRGDTVTAVAELKQAVQLTPNNGVLHYSLAIALRKQDPKAALENVQRARKLGLPDNLKDAALTLEAELTYAAQHSPGPAAQETGVRRNPTDRLEYAWLPPGEFVMGCRPMDSRCIDDEKPAHSVRLTRGFWIGRTEVTVAAFGTFAAATGYKTAAEQEGWAQAWTGKGWGRQDGVNWRNPGFEQGPRHPVVAISWTDAAAFCAWSGGRLPTEAEWEYAARGGSADQVFPWPGPPSHDLANYGKDNGGGPLRLGRDQWEQTSPSASFPPNGFGLFDMAGNVWEWNADWFGAYREDPAADPGGGAAGQFRVLRGGAYNYGPWVMRSSFRYGLEPGMRAVSLGVRCVRDKAP